MSAKAARLIKEYSLQHRHSEPSREANASCKLRVRITRPVLIKTWLARDVSRPASGHLILLVDETNRFELAKCISPKARVQQHGHHNGRWCEISASHVVTQCVLRKKKGTRTHRLPPFIGVHNKWLELLQAGSPHVINIWPFGNDMARE